MINILKNYIDDKGAVRLYGHHIEFLTPLLAQGYQVTMSKDDPNYPTWIAKPGYTTPDHH